VVEIVDCLGAASYETLASPDYSPLSDTVGVTRLTASRRRARRCLREFSLISNFAPCQLVWQERMIERLRRECPVFFCLSPSSSAATAAEEEGE
jgi:hypothetical protein